MYSAAVVEVAVEVCFFLDQDIGEPLNSGMQPERWEEVLDHLSSMISGKRRADGATWRDAHENMPIYLKVQQLQYLAALWVLWFARLCMWQTGSDIKLHVHVLSSAEIGH